MRTTLQLSALILRFISAQLTPEVRHLLHTMLRPDPVDRLPLEDLLSHPWFLQVCAFAADRGIY